MRVTTEDHLRRIFPSLGTAKVTGGPQEWAIGKTGNIITEYDDGTVRIAFDNFWTRPDGVEAEDAYDNTWCFKGEYERS